MLKPLQLEIAQLAVRHAKDLAVQQQDLPMIAQQDAFCGRDAGIVQRAVHRRLEIMVSRQPDAGCGKARDAFSEMLIGRGRVVLRQIACCYNQVAFTL